VVAPAFVPDAGRAALDAAAAPLATLAAAGVHWDVRLRPCAVVHAAATLARVERAASERIVAPTTPLGVVIAAAIADAGVLAHALHAGARRMPTPRQATTREIAWRTWACADAGVWTVPAAPLSAAVAGAMERAVGGAARLWGAQRTWSVVAWIAPGAAAPSAGLRMGVFLDDARWMDAGVDPAMPGSPATWSAVLVPDPDAPLAAALADAIAALERAAANHPLR
jgi:hypothetical protein